MPDWIERFSLSGKTALVTGATKGIGAEICTVFADAGADIIATGRDITDLEAIAEVVKTKGRQCTTLECALEDPTAVEKMGRDAVAISGKVDILVNNAGIAGPTAKVEDVHPEDWDSTLNVCLTGQFNCARVAVPFLRKSSNPSIVNLSSAAGRMGFAMRTPYAAAKWGTIGFTKSLSIELGAEGIRVNAILPGIVAGDRQRRVMESKAQQKGKTFSEIETEAFSYTSIKDYVTAQQLADHILFITSHRGKTVSGQAISICGDIKMLA